MASAPIQQPEPKPDSRGAGEKWSNTFCNREALPQIHKRLPCCRAVLSHQTDLLLLCGSGAALLWLAGSSWVFVLCECVYLRVAEYHFIVRNNHRNKEDLKAEADLFNLARFAFARSG